MKAMCVIVMACLHAWHPLITQSGRVLKVGESDWLWSISAAATWLSVFPLVLPFTAGIALSVEWHRTAPARRRSIRLLSTAVLLFGAGVVLNLAAYGWSGWWVWNVLPFLSLGIAVLAGCALLGERPGLVAAAATGILALGFTEALRAQWLPGWRLGGDSWRPDWIVAILAGDPSSLHTWPFFPWHGMTTAGLLAGTWLRRSPEPAKWLGWAAGFGLMAVVTGDWRPRVWRSDLMGAPAFIVGPGHVLALIGFGGLLLGLCEGIAARLGATGNRILNPLSRGILAAYLVHQLFAVWIGQALVDGVDWPAVKAGRVPWSLYAAWILFPLAVLAVAWSSGWLWITAVAGRRLHLRVRKRARGA